MNDNNKNNNNNNKNNNNNNNNNNGNNNTNNTINDDNENTNTVYTPVSGFSKYQPLTGIHPLGNRIPTQNLQHNKRSLKEKSRLEGGPLRGGFTVTIIMMTIIINNDDDVNCNSNINNTNNNSNNLPSGIRVSQINCPTLRK
jgi:hypothetical protein